MAKTKEYEPVVFEDSQGNEISNDPVWRAQQVLAAAGVGQTPDDSDESIGDDGDDEEKAEDYKSVGGADLKKLAKARKVDISGLRTVGEVRQRLIEDDIRIAAEAEVDAANSGE